MTAFESDGQDSDLRKAYLNEQIMSKRKEADDLLQDAKRLLRLPAQEGRMLAESKSRQALARYRSSLDWAEDSELEDEAHRLLDSAGRWVRETFGCYLERRVLSADMPGCPWTQSYRPQHGRLCRSTHMLVVWRRCVRM